MFDRITLDYNCAIMRDFKTGRLLVQLFPIRFDVEALARLQDMAERFRRWEANEQTKLRHVLSEGFDEGKELGALLSDLSDDIGCLNERLASFSEEGRSDSAHARIRVGMLHHDVESPRFSLEDAQKACAGLEGDEAQRLVHDASMALRCEREVRVFAARADDAIARYVEEINHEIPGISDYRDYACELDKAFSDLDYSSTKQEDGRYCPGSDNPLVKDIDTFYRAHVFEKERAEIERLPNCIMCSHRNSGWGGRRYCALDKDGSLEFVLLANFAYGRAAYFDEALFFKGIRLINHCDVLFYSGIDAMECQNVTNRYPVKESSFWHCFEHAAAVGNDLMTIGPVAFYEKYVDQELAFLLEGMRSVASEDTFLTVSEDAYLEDFVRGAYTRVRLVPNPIHAVRDLGDGYLEARNELARAIADSKDVENAERRVYGSVRGVGDDVCQWLARVEFARNDIANTLFSRFEDIDADQARGLATKIFPEVKDYRLGHYDGFRLVLFRMEKAERAWEVMREIEPLVKAEKSKGIVAAIKDCCLAIAGQAQRYRDEVIAPKAPEVWNALCRTEADLQDFLDSYGFAEDDGRLSWIGDAGGGDIPHALEAMFEKLDSERRSMRCEYEKLEAHKREISAFLARMR